MTRDPSNAASRGTPRRLPQPPEAVLVAESPVGGVPHAHVTAKMLPPTRAGREAVIHAVPTIAIVIDTDLAVTFAVEALNAMVERDEPQRLTIVERGTEFSQKIRFGDRFQLGRVQHLRDLGRLRFLNDSVELASPV